MAPLPANGPVCSTQPSIIACAAGRLSPAAMCPAPTMTAFASGPDFCTYPASSPPSSRHTARSASRNAAKPGHASSRTHAATDAGALCRSNTPWNSSTRVRADARTASTSRFTLRMMSSASAADTTLLHRVHVTAERRLGLARVEEVAERARRVGPSPRVVERRRHARDVPEIAYDPVPLPPGVRPPPRPHEPHRPVLHRLHRGLLLRVDEPGEVGLVGVHGHLRHRVRHAVADRDAPQVHPLLRGHPGVGVQDVGRGRRDVLAGVALAGEEERARAEGLVERHERLERGEEVRGDGRLVIWDVGVRRGRAEAGAERVVEEDDAEAAVPAVGAAGGGGVGEEEVGPQLGEVADQGGAAGPALQPDEERRGGGDRVGGLVEGEVEGVRGGDVEVPRPRGPRLRRERLSRRRRGGGGCCCQDDDGEEEGGRGDAGNDQDPRHVVAVVARVR
ncbi:hypothetical protein EJB05_17719, partial [Eragrostis curvula]